VLAFTGAGLAGAGAVGLLLLPPPTEPYLEVTGLEGATEAGVEGAKVWSRRVRRKKTR